ADDAANAAPRKAAEALHQAAREKVAQAEKNTQALGEELKKDDVTAAFAYLATNRLPKIEEKHFEDAQIAQAFKEIADRRPDKDIAPLVLKISDDALERALSVALENTSNFEKAGDAVGDALRRTDELINQQGKLAAGFYQALLQFEAAESPA